MEMAIANSFLVGWVEERYPTPCQFRVQSLEFRIQKSLRLVRVTIPNPLDVTSNWSLDTDLRLLGFHASTQPTPRNSQKNKIQYQPPICDIVRL